MKELKFIQCAPDDQYFVWQTHLWLESLREIGCSRDATSLIFTPKTREFNVKWKQLEALYPESEFVYYKGLIEVNKLISIYIPILRPYCLMLYFKEHPELKDKTIFYCDSDILFTEKFNISDYINDDICYLSNTNSYINAFYFDSKIKDVIPEKLEEYKKRDILQEACQLVGISREIAEKNNDNSGGAQYLLKNIDSSFWEKVLGDCIKIRVFLQTINREFFESENKGFQSWCCDMWAVLWNLWLREQETKVVPEMDFAWSSDSISKLDKVGIFHNAGITGPFHGEIPVFYKGTYHQGKNPFTDPHLGEVYNSEKSKSLCNWWYVKKMLELKQKYEINYLN